MTLFDLRETIEGAIPWYAPFAFALVCAVVYAVILIKESRSR